MDKKLHWRRCHVCGSLNHSHGGEVGRCQHCGKALAPFFYFSDHLAPTPSDFQLRPPLVPGEYQAIMGLTAHWLDPGEESRK